jgi:hypothetical protein
VDRASLTSAVDRDIGKGGGCRDQLCAAVWLSDGEVLPGSERKPDLRTPFAFDSRHRLLFLAVVRTSRPG